MTEYTRGQANALTDERERPKEKADYYLRQAVSDAIEKLGRETTKEIVREELST